MELWEAVGDLLRKQRLRRGWKYVTDVEKHGGPTYKTVQDIEDGKPKTIDALSKHAAAVGLTLVDVLHSALNRASKPTSPEAAQILRKFERATVQGRALMTALADQLQDAPEHGGPSTPTPPRGGTLGKGPRRSE
jgi:hypothetical protein